MRIYNRYHQFMRQLESIWIFLILTLVSCSNYTEELKYYEKVSGVTLPKKYETIEYFDNGEFITTAIIKISHDQISNFIRINHFKKVSNDFKPQLIGMKYLKKENLNFTNNKTLYLYSGRSINNTWDFLVDNNSGIVYMEIQYPDWARDKP